MPVVMLVVPVVVGFTEAGIGLTEVDHSQVAL